MLEKIPILIIILLSLNQGIAQMTAPDEICGLENTAFQHSEKLVYKLYYNLSFVWIPAGEATFQITETDSTYEASVIGRSYGSYDNFFRVRDEYHSVIDKSTMMPLSFYRKVEEGNHRRYDSIAMDYDLDLIYSHNGRTKAKAHRDTFPLENCSFDLVSIMYTLRNIETDLYAPNDKINFKIFFDEAYAPVNITYLKKEKKKIRNLGKFQTIKIRPEVILGSVFKEGDIMHVWVSDDKNKIPLQIESPIRVGSVKAVLLSHENTRYPLEKL